MQPPDTHETETLEYVESELDSTPADETERLARAHFSRGGLYYFTYNDAEAREDLERVQQLVPPSHDLYQTSAELLAEIVGVVTS